MALRTDASMYSAVDKYDYKSQFQTPCWKRKSTWCIITAVIIVAVTVFLTLYFVTNDGSNAAADELPRNQYIEQQFLQIPSNNSCSNLSRILAAEPHVAIDSRTLELASILSNMFDEMGYDVIRDNLSNMVFDHYISSSLSLSLPNATNLQIDLSNGFISGDDETNTSLRHRAWQAFGASGNVSAPFLYVGTASDSHLDYLAFNLSFNLSQYIAVVTNGDRAGKAERIGIRGMLGMIQFESNYNDPDTVYPNGPYRPNSGYMYGRIRKSTNCPGNPNPQRIEQECGFNLTEYEDLYPALEYNLPSIIISADNAIQIFDLFAAFSDTNGSLCNLPDTFQPGNLPLDNVCVGGVDIIGDLRTENEISFNDTIQNVYGYFEGSTYPDEIVMIGAHRDAWGNGASDDISGTVTMMEIARALSVLRDEYDWSPRRSLMFGSWDGEEWGLYGSVEFNENPQRKADYIDRIVCYINFDMTVTGENIRFLSNPLFRSLLFESAEEINYPYNDFNYTTNMTLFDAWNMMNPSGELALVTTGSDYGAFEYYSGVPTLGVRFDTFPAPFPDVYHTFYDLNGVLDLMDPQWKYAESIAKLGGLLMLKVADAHILPFDVIRFGQRMTDWMETDLMDRADAMNCSIEEQVDLLIDAISQFNDSAVQFDGAVSELYAMNGEDGEGMDTEMVAQYNAALMAMTRSLVHPEGRPSGRWYKHMVIDAGTRRFPYIWDRITAECDEDDLEEAFLLTQEVIANATSILIDLFSE